jgi:CBS domain-containing protein
MQRESPLLHYLAMQCVANRAPLSFFNNFVVEKNGENKDMLDIENRGLKPIADFARILALRSNIRGTNTFERLKRLLAVGEISKELFNATIEAYELQMQLQVIHQLSQIESGSTPDNFINPAHLTDIEERMLKDAFRVIEKMQGVLVKLFPEA